MKKLELVRQHAFGGSIAVLYLMTTLNWVHYLGLSEMVEFGIYTSFGLVGILGGLFFARFGLAIGLTLGGLLNFVVGSVAYWSRMNALIKFGGGLFILIILSYVVFKGIEEK